MRDTARVHGERGVALLAVLLVFVIIGGSSASFIWFMNQQQSRAGFRLRSTAALAAAEAGVHRALSILETVAPDDGGPGRTWRPAAHAEVISVGALEGRFTLSLVDEADGAIVITSVGEVTGVARRLRARVNLASPALLAALHGTSLVRLERPPATLVIVPYRVGRWDQPWIHVAAGRGIGFGETEVSINDPTLVPAFGPGPADGLERGSPGTFPTPGPVRLLLARGADITVGQGHRRVDVQQLRLMGVRLDGEVRRVDALPNPPEVDWDYFQSLASANMANAALHEAAGKYLGNEDLLRKADSLYTLEQFEQLQSYLLTGPAAGRFYGVVYIRGPVALEENQRIEIIGGALITEGTLRLRHGSSLAVVHSPASRTLPGILVLGQTTDPGLLVVARNAKLHAHGLVYASRTIDVWEGARVDVVGAIVANDAQLSFRNVGGSVVVRYDSAVLGTRGLRASALEPVAAWVASWEELP